MPAERRSAETIREEIAVERAELEKALTDLRKGVDAKRKPAAAVVGALVVAFVAALTVKVARRIRGA